MRKIPYHTMAHQYTIMGYMEDAQYQQCSEAAEYLNATHPTLYKAVAKRLLGFEFEEVRAKLLEQKKILDPNVRVIVVDETIGRAESASEFLSRITKETEFKLFECEDSDPNSYSALARKNHALYLKSTGAMFAWMTVSIGDMLQGRIVFQLFSNLVPRTCQNFLHLCRGDLPDAVGEDGAPIRLHYKDTTFYRAVKNGWIQGGDVSGKGGNGGYSAYGRYFPDESFAVKHNDVGILGMVNDGEHTNASSFYITLQKSEWMDTRYVAFGRVVEGLSIVNAIAAVETKHNQSFKVPVTISDCGEI